MSNIVREIRSGATLTYQVGTRNANTVLHLKDGETQILAGLISDDERKVADKVPGLGSLPVLGRLFSSQRDTATKTVASSEGTLSADFVKTPVGAPEPSQSQMIGSIPACFSSTARDADRVIA